MLKASDIAQVIKKYIYLSGAKSNDSLHTVSLPNIFKFTKISVKGTQNHSNGMNETKETCRRKPHITTRKIFAALYICNNSRMALLYSFDFFVICRN